jgi:predicted ester cyclase
VHIASRRDGPRGPEAFKQVIGMWHRACSLWHMTIEELIGEGDKVTNRFTTRATHDGPLMGIAPTGKSFVVQSLEMHRIADGRVAESWIVDDMPSILVQLGVLPPPNVRPG